MSVFKSKTLGKSMARSIDEQLALSMEAKRRSAPAPPTKSSWGWTPPGSELGEVNFQQVVLSSPRVIEHAARIRSKGTWGVRHPSQSMEDYLAMISSHVPDLSDDTVAKYLEQFNATRFEQIAITKRRYNAWIKHFVAVLHALDTSADQTRELIELELEPNNPTELQRKKKKKGTKL
jgi:hypothetical protein